jgi:hypothetical protein
VSDKRSRRWYRRVVREWDRYVGDRATVQEYAAGGAPYLTRLRQDLQEWWGNHPDPAKRLTAEEVEALAQRLEGLIRAYLSPITPGEMVQRFRSHWSTLDAVPGGPLQQAGMGGRSVMSGGEDDTEES